MENGIYIVSYTSGSRYSQADRQRDTRRQLIWW